jgi:uncharacterized protein (DUF433 family)
MPISSVDLRMEQMSVPVNLSEVVSVEANVVSGTPVFKGTRVLVPALLDHLEAGDSLEKFLDGFPSVDQEQAVRFIELAGQAALKELARPA